jgi:predicted RNA-binding protein YlxR (DUF448 family)
MLRVVRTGDGSLALGPGLPGRGAWLCRSSPGCIDEAVKRQAFSRALRDQVASVDVERLRAELASRPEEMDGSGSEAPVL